MSSTTLSPELIRYNRSVDLKRLKFIEQSLRGAVPHNARVLDVGCGNGNISLYLGSLGYQVRGVDISPKAIENARSRNPYANVVFDVVSAEQLAAGNEKYEAIICSEVLEHLDQPKLLLDTLYQLLADDGMLIVTVPNGRGPREVLMTKPMQWMIKNNGVLWQATKGLKKMLGYKGTTNQSDADNLQHVQFFSYKDLTRLSAASHFKIKKFRHADFISDVFPFSMLAKRSSTLQELDCQLADQLPTPMVAGFLSAWQKAK